MRFRSRQRLRSQADFAAVRKEGRRQHGTAFVVSVRLRPLRPATSPEPVLPRFAVIASRRVGPAVVRNGLKRRLREIFREHQCAFPAQADVVVVLQAQAVGKSFDDLRAQFLRAVRRFGFSAEQRAPDRPAPTPQPDRAAESGETGAAVR